MFTLKCLWAIQVEMTRIGIWGSDVWMGHMDEGIVTGQGLKWSLCPGSICKLYPWEHLRAGREIQIQKLPESRGFQIYLSIYKRLIRKVSPLVFDWKTGSLIPNYGMHWPPGGGVEWRKAPIGPHRQPGLGTLPVHEFCAPGLYYIDKINPMFFKSRPHFMLCGHWDSEEYETENHHAQIR